MPHIDWSIKDIGVLLWSHYHGAPTLGLSLRAPLPGAVTPSYSNNDWFQVGRHQVPHRDQPIERRGVLSQSVHPRAITRGRHPGAVTLGLSPWGSHPRAITTGLSPLVTVIMTGFRLGDIEHHTMTSLSNVEEYHPGATLPGPSPWDYHPWLLIMTGFRLADIECRTVTGLSKAAGYYPGAINTDNPYTDHAWSMVHIGHSWYFLDATWLGGAVCEYSVLTEDVCI